MRIIRCGVSISPYFRVLTVADLFSLTQDNLVRYLILLIYFIIFFEYFFSIIDSHILRNRNIEACFFSIHITISFNAEFFRMIGSKNRRSFDEKLIGDMKAVIADKRSLSCLEIPVIEC